MTDDSHGIEATLDRMAENWPQASAAQAGTVIAAQRLARLVQRIAQSSLRGISLTPTEFELLSALRAHTPPHRLTPSDLYDAMLISSGGLTKLLKGLEARGLVLRPQSSGDGRSRPVELSDDGQALVERAMAAVQAAEAPVMRAMAGAWRGETDLAEGLIALADAAEHAEEHDNHNSSGQVNPDTGRHGTAGRDSLPPRCPKS